MIGLIVAVILGILLIGVLLKLIKFAILVALCVGAYVLVRNNLGQKRIP